LLYFKGLFAKAVCCSKDERKVVKGYFFDDFFFNIESYLYFCEQNRIRVYATVSVVV